GHCVNGVCCDTECTGICEACDDPSTLGTCRPIEGDPHSGRRCGGEGACKGSCDGKKPRECTFPDESVRCGPSSCGGGSERHRACDAAGSCSLVTEGCSPYLCGADACKTSCDTSADCAETFVCLSHHCLKIVRAACTDEHTLTDPRGRKRDCSPYLCDPE